MFKSLRRSGGRSARRRARCDSSSRVSERARAPGESGRQAESPLPKNARRPQHARGRAHARPHAARRAGPTRHLSRVFAQVAAQEGGAGGGRAPRPELNALPRALPRHGPPPDWGSCRQSPRWSARRQGRKPVAVPAVPEPCRTARAASPATAAGRVSLPVAALRPGRAHRTVAARRWQGDSLAPSPTRRAAGGGNGAT